MLLNNNDNLLDCDGRVNSNDSSARCCARASGTQVIGENPPRSTLICSGIVHQRIMGTSTITTGLNQNEVPLKQQESADGQNINGSHNISDSSKCTSDAHGKSIRLQTHQPKGLKRARSELSSGEPVRPALVLSSVSTNIANNHDQPSYQQPPLDQIQQPQAPFIHHRSVGGQIGKWPPGQSTSCSAAPNPGARPFDHDQHQQERPSCCLEASAKLPSDNNDDQAKDNNRHATIAADDQYDYDTILAKILNEKKLNLAKSPEVIRFLCNVKHQTGASVSHQRRVIM